jgi:hypothetical protein
VSAAAASQLLKVNGVTVWCLLTWLQLVFSLALCYRLARAVFGRGASPLLLLFFPFSWRSRHYRNGIGLSISA